MSQSILLPPPGSIASASHTKSATPRDAPVMSRMLEAQAQLTPIPDMGQEDELVLSGDTVAQTSPSLVIRLMEIFGFEKPEEVKAG